MIGDEQKNITQNDKIIVIRSPLIKSLSQNLIKKIIVCRRLAFYLKWFKYLMYLRKAFLFSIICAKLKLLFEDIIFEKKTNKQQNKSWNKISSMKKLNFLRLKK